jgi:hypothetical protein
METESHSPDNQSIALLDNSGSPLSFRVLELKLPGPKKVKSCHLVLQADLNLYSKITEESLFNLDHNLCNPPPKDYFKSSYPLEIEILLTPEFLGELENYSGHPKQAFLRLKSLSESLKDEIHDSQDFGTREINPSKTKTSQNSSSLLHSRNWLVLTIKQGQASEEICFHTFWSYISPFYLNQEAISRKQFSNLISRYLKERNDADIIAVEKVIREVFETIENEFQVLSNSDFLKQSEVTIENILTEFGQAVDDWSSQAFTQESSSEGPSIYNALIHFFSEDDWEFAKVKGEFTLRLAAQGKHEQFTCYAKALDDRDIFLFYSVFPVQAPKKKRRIVSDLLARINFGLLIGNFELNFDTGEIFFKTSINVTEYKLSQTLIRNLVYTNLITMDKYTPSILAVLEQKAKPEEAIEAIENGNPQQNRGDT